MRQSVLLLLIGAACGRNDQASTSTTAASASSAAPSSSATTAAAPSGDGFDESLIRALAAKTIGGQILDASGRPAKDVLVYVKSGLPAGHKNPTPAKVVVDQADKQFVPRVVPVLVGSTVEFKNSDAVLHNVYSRSTGKTFDLGAYSNKEAKSTTFDKPGRVDVFCAIHTNMHAVVHVLENPYFATTDARGGFAIRDIPPGRYTVEVVEETTGKREANVEVTAEAAGVVRLKLSDGR